MRGNYFSIYFIAILLICRAFPSGGQGKAIAEMTAKLDSIVLNGMDSMAYPGAQVLVLKNGMKLYHKAHGSHTYKNERPVQTDDIYDLASITKVSTGLPILMKLYGEGKFNLDASIEDYLPEFKRSAMSGKKIREILAHQAGYLPYIVFWKEAFKSNGSLKRKSFAFSYSKEFPIKVGNGLFLHRDYNKQMYDSIKKSAVESDLEYRYSGLFFLLLPELISTLVNDDFESYLYEQLYIPLGLPNLTYNPRKRFPKERIIPTENDTFFRFHQVHGIVHDEAAAMLNGVSCNAGLFGNAESLAKLFQFYLDEGNFEGKQIIDSSAIREFTRYQFPENNNRRGLGFDKPMLEYDQEMSYVARDASASSFGHSGFTGTFIWADPEYNLIFVFLSNRVFPTRDSRKLYSMKIRSKLHQVVYDALPLLK